jgi:hypothetical protein
MMKNCMPLVFLPRLAMHSWPRCVVVRAVPNLVGIT